MKPAPDYVPPHGLLKGKSVLVTAAAGAGIGFSAAKRCAEEGWRAQVEQAHYAAAKAGVMAFTRCSAMEAAEFGVRINAVAPSIAIHAFLKKSASEELLNQLAGKEAFGRGAEPWEIANVMVFLA